jgi:hypothetical protein
MAFADMDLAETDEHAEAPSFLHSDWFDVHSGGIALAGCAAFWMLVAVSLYYIL